MGKEHHDRIEKMRMTESVKILRNRVECALCHDVIESLHRHDYRVCSCGEIFIDGGLDYLRRGAVHPVNLIDHSETQDECSFCRDALKSPRPRRSRVCSCGNIFIGDEDPTTCQLVRLVDLEEPEEHGK